MDGDSITDEPIYMEWESDMEWERDMHRNSSLDEESTSDEDSSTSDEDSITDSIAEDKPEDRHATSFIWTVLFMLLFPLVVVHVFIMQIHHRFGPSSGPASLWHLASSAFFFSWFLQVLGWRLYMSMFSLRFPDDCIDLETRTGVTKTLVKQIYMYVCAVILMVLGARFQYSFDYFH